MFTCLKSCPVIAMAAILAAPPASLAGALPRHLTATGLYVEGSATEVAPDVLPFEPQYPLWSDGATKRRWIQLPRGTAIDATQPDAWQFPPGTRLWKEFALGGRRVETRLIERLADGSWRYATYVWNEEGSDAVLAPAEGAASLYAIPSEPDCRACHEGAAVPVLGFSALQLSPDVDPLAPHASPARAERTDLRSLVVRGALRNLPPALLANPPRIAAATPIERAALGYLHGNCGHCHGVPGDTGASVPVGVRLAQQVSDPASADKVRDSLIRAASRFPLPGTQGAAQVVVPGKSHASVLYARMRSRDPRMQMPPLGTAAADSAALALIERWIDQNL